MMLPFATALAQITTNSTQEKKMEKKQPFHKCLEEVVVEQPLLGSFKKAAKVPPQASSLSSQNLQSINRYGPDVKAAVATMTDRVIKSLDELKKRDDIVAELQSQLQDAMKLFHHHHRQQQQQPTHQKQFPSLRRKKLKKRIANKKCTFGGFVTQGTMAPSKQPLRPNRTRSTLQLSPSRKLRHTYLKKDRSTRTSINITKEVSPMKKCRSTKSKDIKRKMRKISKYGRTKNNESKFRQSLKNKIKQKWSIHQENTILYNSMNRIKAAAHGRMKPTFSNFDTGPIQRKQFRKLMLLELNVNLSNTELDSVFDHFDRDGSNSIDYREVVHQLLSDFSPSESRVYHFNT